MNPFSPIAFEKPGALTRYLLDGAANEQEAIDQAYRHFAGAVTTALLSITDDARTISLTCRPERYQPPPAFRLTHGRLRTHHSLLQIETREGEPCPPLNDRLLLQVMHSLSELAEASDTPLAKGIRRLVVSAPPVERNGISPADVSAYPALAQFTDANGRLGAGALLCSLSILMGVTCVVLFSEHYSKLQDEPHVKRMRKFWSTFICPDLTCNDPILALFVKRLLSCECPDAAPDSDELTPCSCWQNEPLALSAMAVRFLKLFDKGTETRDIIAYIRPLAVELLRSPRQSYAEQAEAFWTAIGDASAATHRVHQLLLPENHPLRHKETVEWTKADKLKASRDSRDTRLPRQSLGNVLFADSKLKVLVPHGNSTGSEKARVLDNLVSVFKSKLENFTWSPLGESARKPSTKRKATRSSCKAP